MAGAALEIENLGFGYGKGSWVFRNHSFRVRPGEIAAILGPNGRGKTTLLKTIAGLNKAREGRVILKGQMGIVPQETWTPFPYSALDMVLMGRAPHLGIFSSPGRKDMDKALASMALLNIQQLRNRAFTTLSGGERQMVLIARALTADCEILVLDEPASALDFKNQEIILKTLKSLSREKELTILLTTHFPQHAVYLADKALLMYGPKEYLYGDVDKVLNDETLGSLYQMDIRNIRFSHGNRDIQTVVPVFT